MSDFFSILIYFFIIIIILVRIKNVENLCNICLCCCLVLYFADHFNDCLVLETQVRSGLVDFLCFVHFAAFLVH